jgi:pimeloyl-ACP methyl ester carboxylesterase
VDWLRNALDWIAGHESALSGIAATIAIGAVLVAFGSRTLVLFRRAEKKSAAAPRKSPRQEIRYCRSPAGHRIAWSSAGKGFPLVRSLGWFTNLEMEWNSPVASPFWHRLASQHRLIRYDGRGMGLSQRDVTEFSAASRLEDLEAVIEAAGIERFALMGLSEGGSTALRYAAKYPDRVSHLVIWGSFLVAPRFADVPQFAAVARLIPDHWGSDSPAFHQMFTAMILPDGNAAQNKLFNDMQRLSATAATATAFIREVSETDVRDIAPTIETPALVLHRKGDLAIPAKFGEEFAAALPNARMMLLDGSNHWMVTEEDDMEYIAGLIDEFLSQPVP